MTQYLAFFEFGKNCVGVVFPDIPSVITSGKNYEEAYENALQALSLFAETEKLPKAQSFEEIKNNWADFKEWKNYDFITSYVPVISNKTKTKRINITLSESLITRLDRITDNRSGFIEKTLNKVV